MWGLRNEGNQSLGLDAKKKQLNSRLIIIFFPHFSHDDIQNANERYTTGRHKTDDKTNNENNIDGEVLNARRMAAEK